MTTIVGSERLRPPVPMSDFGGFVLKPLDLPNGQKPT
jgi:hypothetical protein